MTETILTLTLITLMGGFGLTVGLIIGLFRKGNA
jgi:hypothetical protein